MVHVIYRSQSTQIPLVPFFGASLAHVRAIVDTVEG